MLSFKDNSKTRPKLKIEQTPLDILLEVFSFISLFYLFYYVFTNYSILPEQIPMHFNSSGEIDDFGSKSNIFLLPVIALGIYTLLTIINKFPHTFNYLTEITNKNAYVQYKLATRMIRFLKLDIILIFTFITFQIIREAKTGNSNLGEWFIPIIIGSSFVPIIIFIILMLKSK